MSNDDPGLDAAYALRGPDDSRRLYRRWAETYDSDFATGEGYALPDHVAAAFVDAGGRGPVLDVGAGTGLVGERLAALDVGPVEGCDISPEMLEIADRKGVYARLFEADITAGLPAGTGPYAGVVSAGTFTLGHVGPEALATLLDAAAPGAAFALSVNAAHWRAAGFDAALEALGDRIVERRLREVPIYQGDGANRPDTAQILSFARL
ncbi:class I SAM-dependent methyltransferase [Rhodobacteraceae bacterium CCMM004]|nr:class I SAM-dependent methyltransferase [Rhodobacteraceae bacterium CCMM004]